MVMLRPLLGLCWTATLVASGTAQDPVAQPQKVDPLPTLRITTDKIAGRARLTVDAYDEEYSRSLFAACDSNADDRLDVIEAERTIEYLIAGQPREAFQRLDTNSDGYVNFPEFDREYRAMVGRGSSLRLLPARPLPPLQPRRESPDLALAVRLVAIYDTNGDEQLNAKEFATLVERRRVGGDRNVLFTGMDTDASSTLSADELTGFARRPGMTLSPDADLTAHQRLPPPFRAADLDQDGALSLGELDRLLRRVDPELRRWTRALVTNADKSGNGTLGLPELQAALTPIPQIPKSIQGTDLTPEQRKMLEDFLRSRPGK